MANLQLANNCNLFSYRFSGENQETLLKTQGIIPKTFQIWAKNSRIWKKTSRIWGPVGPTGPPKSAQKTRPLVLRPLGCDVRVCRLYRPGFFWAFRKKNSRQIRTVSNSRNFFKNSSKFGEKFKNLPTEIQLFPQFFQIW